MITLVECLYREFVGKLDDHVAMAKEAFYKAQICDFIYVYDFVNYCKNLLYIARLYHSTKAKIIFIHEHAITRTAQRKWNQPQCCLYGQDYSDTSRSNQLSLYPAACKKRAKSYKTLF